MKAKSNVLAGLHTRHWLREYAEAGPPTPRDIESLVTSLIWDGNHAAAERLAATMMDHFHGGRRAGKYDDIDRSEKFYWWFGVHTALSSQSAMRKARRERRAA